MPGPLLAPMSVPSVTSLSDSTRTWSYSLRATKNMMDVTFSKQWIHFLRSDLCPPTSTILKGDHMTPQLLGAACSPRPFLKDDQAGVLVDVQVPYTDGAVFTRTWVTFRPESLYMAQNHIALHKLGQTSFPCICALA